MPVSARMKRTPNCVGICIDEDKNCFRGRVYSCFSKEPQTFSDINELFYIVDSVMDALSFPAIKTKNRTFKKTEAEFTPATIDVENKVLGADELIPADVSKGFVLMVTSRDNVTWQGIIYDKTKDEEFNFNSEVELIRLLK
ncbi:hypothetical protein SAMN05421493_11329 [Pseudobutyrivibrio sp. 49]|uniref:hypothetical protein n=1 Tax=unclassified Pseudobutyrivibrio TaxID=2638619 RepID=UPI000885024B|nr:MULTISPECIES: hypothetical protein [unclassified Pseudobutyrivibrio]SDI39042.1 hypothetical protein SAMN05421493_11329 [Pseudobutyrivibrio sp. 49]SFO06427.1 hypothetical protein SAMN04487831_10747 [Pseudobutyrivibrio sp. UC1225]